MFNFNISSSLLKPALKSALGIVPGTVVVAIVVVAVVTTFSRLRGPSLDTMGLIATKSLTIGAKLASGLIFRERDV